VGVHIVALGLIGRGFECRARSVPADDLLADGSLHVVLVMSVANSMPAHPEPTPFSRKGESER
jgi:hypothetical protein